VPNARKRDGQARAYDRTVSESTKKVLLAKPRGYCAGVDRAVVTVEKALAVHGAPIYVRK
jgi:4-hydroxy-3-methylbut-2-enyl diphosphate reductase